MARVNRFQEHMTWIAEHVEFRERPTLETLERMVARVMDPRWQTSERYEVRRYPTPPWARAARNVASNRSAI